MSGVIHTGLSDHSLIYGIRKINISSKESNNIVEIRNLKKFNEDDFIQDLANQSWDHIFFYGENPNHMWEIWKELFMEILNKHAPIQHKKVKSKNVPWITNEIKQLIVNRDKLKRKAIITNLEIDWQNYRKARNETNIKLREVKKEYFLNKINSQKKDPKSAWKTINSLLGKQNKPTKINELNFKDKTLTNPIEIAEGFNDFFSNIGPNLADQINQTTYKFQDYVDYAFQAVTVNQIHQLLNKLSNSKATGIDKISSRFIKLAAPMISSSLTFIFNQAMSSFSFPDEWKIARVIPVFKNGKQNLPGNYRPISILPSISKIMERIIYSQLYEYLATNDILSEHQFGFRKFHSTSTALLDSTNDWYVNMDRKLFNLVVFIDLKKAFDTVDHQILIEKLELCGIKGDALKLLESYLSGRSQTCQVDRYSSSKRGIKCGVPQGSILGPLLFLIYINDLPNCLNQTKPRLFADDTNITVSGESIDKVEIAMNSDLENLRKWLMANKLSLNVAKTEFLLIGSKKLLKKSFHRKPEIKIQREPLKQVSETKSLGIILDQHLDWKRNTDNICKKVTSGISAIRRLKEYVDQNTLKSVYNAIVHPYFTYCCEVWDVFGETQSKRLQRLHNRAARIIANLPNRTNQKTALDAVGWEPLAAQREKAKAKIMYKTLNNMGPNSLNRLFTFKNENSNYNLRNSCKTVCLPKPRTNYMKKSFAYNGGFTWNSLPNEIRENKSFPNFKRKIATYNNI